MKVTDAFIGEHGVLHAMLDTLEAAAGEWERPEEARADGVMLTAALDMHARLEEDLLFVDLDRHLGEGGPLAVMREEHDDIEASLGRLLQSGDRAEAVEVARHLVSVARDHFAKEESILFPMADSLIGEERLLELGERWAERRIPASQGSGSL